MQHHGRRERGAEEVPLQQSAGNDRANSWEPQIESLIQSVTLNSFLQWKWTVRSSRSCWTRSCRTSRWTTCRRRCRATSPGTSFFLTSRSTRMAECRFRSASFFTRLGTATPSCKWCTQAPRSPCKGRPIWLGHSRCASWRNSRRSGSWKSSEINARLMSRQTCPSKLKENQKPFHCL